ncbi:MAG: YceI family protein [Sulfuriferula sp.]|nr:YceI family protein [Sulfuriferula sp.]
MHLKRMISVLSGVVIAISLLSCTALPSAAPAGSAMPVQSQHSSELGAVYAALKTTGGQVFTLDPAKSAIRIYVFRGGSAARLGHNHVLSAPAFTGYFYLPDAGASNGRFDLEFRLDQLEFDNPAYRSALGSAFSSTLTPEAIAGARQHMLGHDNMQADQYPVVRVHSLQIVGESPKFAARVQIEMHGQQREMWIPLSVEGLPDALTVTGSFVLRQTDFGVRPYSVLGGLLAVQDEVVIEFRLLGG